MGRREQPEPVRLSVSDGKTAGTGIPKVYSPAEVAEAWGCSERTLRETARRVGGFHLIGKTMFFTEEDLAIILEAHHTPLRPPTASANDLAIERARERLNRGRPRSAG